MLIYGGERLNNARRKKLKEVSCLLDRAIGIINATAEAEQDALDNIPESFQDTERCEKMEDAVGLLESAAEKIEDAKDKIEEAVQ